MTGPVAVIGMISKKAGIQRLSIIGQKCNMSAEAAWCVRHDQPLGR